MRFDRAFRLSFYLTLGLACVCLGYSDLYFLPWMSIFTAVMLACILIAYRIEERWTLSVEGANLLGVVIAFGSIAWIYLKLPKSPEDLLAGGVPWPAGLLPLVAPLLMGLLLVKLYRPKGTHDFWVIQTIGLMMVILGCILAGEPFFGVLLMMYLFCLLWCLLLFYFHGKWIEHGHRRPEHASLLGPDPRSPQVPWRWLGMRSAFACTFLALSAGFLLYLVAPRQTDAQWIPQRLSPGRNAKIRSGTQSGSVDIGLIGQVELSEEEAFRVGVIDWKGAPASLNSTPRWRVRALDDYNLGQWTRIRRLRRIEPSHFIGSVAYVLAAWPFSHQEQRLRLCLQFDVDRRRTSGLVLAEPVLTPRRRGGIKHRGHEVSYEQWTVPYSKTAPAYFISESYERVIAQNAPDAIRHITVALLDRLGPAYVRGIVPDDGPVPLQHRRTVAHALERVLASSGEFKYSLKYRRVNHFTDPNVDFLRNSKKGYCMHFASSLALMLRSVGIPSRLVLGYRGAERTSVGHYLVRKKHAHAWVEALISDPDNPSMSYWLTLDPTPSSEVHADGVKDLFGWLAENWNNGGRMWKRLIMDYNNSQQKEALSTVWSTLTSPKNLLVVVSTVLVTAVITGILVLSILILRLMRQHHTRRTRVRNDRREVAFYANLLDVLARHCRCRPTDAQTPQEFAHTASLTLGNMQLPSSIAAVPTYVVRRLYEVRFGGRQLSAQEQVQIQQKISQLDHALRQLATVGRAVPSCH